MIVLVRGKRIIEMAAKIDRSLVRLGKRCCAVRSQRRLHRSQLPVR
jgi:hypothetical protein